MNKLAVKRKYLLVVSGLLWTAVGIMLLRFAYLWLVDINTSARVSFALLGFMLGVLIAALGLSKVARKNIKRIRHLPEKAPLLAFQARKNYITIALMISMGVFLRTSSFVAKPYLAILYTAMGSALMLASLSYYSEYKLKSV